MKIYVFVVNRPVSLEISRQFHAIYFRHQDRPWRKHILDRFVRYCCATFSILKYLYFSVGTLFGLCPLIIGIVLQERLLPFGFFLPYFDHTTNPGFEINYVFSMLMVYLAVHGLAASETYFVQNIILGIGHMQMMLEMLNELNEQLGRVEMRRSFKLDSEIEMKIKEVIFEHQEHMKFMKVFEELFSNHSLFMVGSASLVIVICLVVLVKIFWVIGLFMMAMMFWQILFICALGTAFETSCWQFTERLYTIDWHLMLPRHRKYWRMVIQIAQRPHLNTMGGVMPSNLNTFMLVSDTYT